MTPRAAAYRERLVKSLPVESAASRVVMRILIVCAALLLSVGPSPVHALCAPTVAPVNVSDPYDFVSAVVDSLALAKAGRARQRTQPVTEGPPLLDALADTKLAASEYRCAADTLAPFDESPDMFIRPGAQGLRTVYGRLATLLDAQVTLIANAIDRDAGGEPVTIGTPMNRLSEFAAHTDEMWRSLLTAVVTATHALPKLTDSGQLIGRLRITETQRHTLIGRLEMILGASLRGVPKADQQGLECAAEALRNFLADPSWISADSE